MAIEMETRKENTNENTKTKEGIDEKTTKKIRGQTTWQRKRQTKKLDLSEQNTNSKANKQKMKEKPEPKRTQKMLNLATWNVRGINNEGAVKNIIGEIKKYGIDILATQETNIKGEKITSIENYMWFNGGGEKNKLGTSFFVKADLKSSIVDYRRINDRMSLIRIKGKYRKITIVNIHAPTEEADDEEKQQFYEELEETYEKIPSFDIKIVLGDMNAKVGKEERNVRITGRHSLHEVTNNNGQRVINFAAEKKMIVKTTSLAKKNIYKQTWKSPDGRTINQIDHLLIERIHANCIKNVRTYRGADIDSDHFLVMAKIEQLIPRLTSSRNIGGRRCNIKALKNEETRNKYCQTIAEKLRCSPTDISIQDEWTAIDRMVKQTATQELGKRIQTKRNGWFDSECEKLLQERRKVRQKMIQEQNQETTEKFKEARRKFHVICRSKKREFVKRKIEEIEENHAKNETRKFYKNLEIERKGYQPRSIVFRNEEGKLVAEEKEILKLWVEFYSKILTSQDKSEDDPEDLNRTEWEEVEEPTLEEVKKVMDAMKNNKSPGSDDLQAELFKYGGITLTERIHELIVRVWRSKIMPNEWSLSIIQPIHKKGNKQKMENYRPISLLNVVYKIMASITNQRLQEQTEKKIGDYQAGFRKGRSVIDQIFVLSQIQEKCERKNIQIHCIFLDFRQAYDRIKRADVFKAMSELEYPRELIDLVRMTLSNTRNKVKFNGNLSEEFVSNVGLKQGDPMSTTLFNIILESIMRKSKIKTKGNIFRSSYQCIAYADDLTILARTREELKGLIKRIEEQASKVGLEINQKKSKYMVMGKTKHPVRNLLVNIETKNKVYELEQVDDIVYLGAEFTSDANHTKNLERRITAGSRCVGAFRNLLSDKDISRSVKVKLYKTIIRPIATFASETWVLTQEDLRKIEIWERKVLRRIFGGIKENDEWRRRTNKELAEVYNEPNIGSVIRQSRLRWLGHLIRLDENRLTKIMFQQEPRGVNRRGRPRKSWMDGVKEDLNELGIIEWETLARNRKEWRKAIQAMGL